MSKIFISHSHKDEELHDILRDSLTFIGHDVIGIESLSVGSNISKDLNNLLHAADVVVAIITEESLHSKHVLNEITVALAQMDAVESKLFLPIVVGENIEIPSFLSNRLVEIVPNFKNGLLQKVVSNIQRSIEKSKAAQEEKSRLKNEQVKKLESSKAEFIREAEERLNSKETSLRNSANVWYGFGYMALVIWH